MTPLTLPDWLPPHLFADKTFRDLTPAEVEALRRRLALFKPAAPEVSVVIPAWNEADNIFRTLSSLAANVTSQRVEIIVVNNNSTDSLQQVLDTLGVVSYFEPRQGIAYARQLGLEKARGTYHLCADADTFYPPHWIELMTQPMRSSADVTGVYGRYAFLPPHGQGRRSLWVYEFFASLMVQVRKKKQEAWNVLGFNMGFVAAVGRTTGGFQTDEVRVFHNEQNVEESEDGRIAVRLSSRGQLNMVTAAKALVFTSSRKILQDGSVFQAFLNRFRRHVSRVSDYI